MKKDALVTRRRRQVIELLKCVEQLTEKIRKDSLKVNAAIGRLSSVDGGDRVDFDVEIHLQAIQEELDSWKESL